MIQEAINTLVGLLDKYPDTYKISIVDINHIELSWSDEKFHTKIFKSAIELLEWLENNLDEKH